MPAASFLEIAKCLIETPTAPFKEQWVASVLDDILSGIPGLKVDIDRFGNRICLLKRGNPKGHAPTFVAHMDHPGFLINGVVDSQANRYKALFEGRVLTEFFHNTPIRVFRHEGDLGVTGVVSLAGEEIPADDNRQIELHTSEAINGAQFAMWDLEPFRIDGDWLHARVCDDLVGVAAIVTALRSLALSDAKDLNVSAIFSRAEEAGFCGVLCLLKEEEIHPFLDPNGIFISVEISSERPGVECGGGAIIRAGDRMSTFDGEVTDILWRLASREKIAARRVLMDGGTCEATVFARAGLRTGGLCIPLKHYHNMNRTTGKISPEIVSISDANALIALIASFSLHHATIERMNPDLDFDLFLRKGREQLRAPQAELSHS